MLRPVIMIGCGGSGQKAVRYIRDAVRRQLDHAGWQGDFPRSWQFIGLDTLNIQEAPGEIPTMPSSDYLSVSLDFNVYQELENALLAQHPIHSPGYKELIGWRPVAEQVVVPLKDGAGQMRAVGRIAGVVSLSTVVRPKLQEAFTECTAGGPELQLVSEQLGVPVPPGTTTPEPIVVVLGSMAGGTGAGIMLDVLDLVRRTDTSGAYPIAVIFTPDIFGIQTTDAMSANGLALLSELMSAFWDNELSDASLIPSVVPTNNRGPHATFLVGRKNLDGIDLDTSINVYRAVGEAIGSWVTSSGVQEAIWNFITVNWPQYSSANMGGYPFGEVYQPGVVSSFGSATLSIGRDRFRDYAKKLLMRELLENLYEGHLKKAPLELGKDADNLTESAVLNTLVELHRQDFFTDCGIAQRGGEDNQVTDRFASAELTTDELAEVKRELGAPFGSQEWDALKWHVNLLSQANIVKKSSLGRAISGFDHEVVLWGPEVFEKILRVTSVYVGRYGLKMAAELIRAAQSELAQVSAEVSEEAAGDRRSSAGKLEEAKSALRNAGGGEIGFEAAPVRAAFDHLAKAVTSEWRATRRERTADAMENLANQVLAPLAALTDQAHGRVHEMVNSIGGEPALIDTWPKYLGGIPQIFLPSPLEFFLEDVDTWPGMLEDLLSDAMEITLEHDDPTVSYQPSNSVDATRYLLNVGDFAADQDTRVPPIVWATTYGAGSPQWSPGGNPQIEIAVTHDEVEKRVNAWMNRPATKIARTLNEGLRDYLASIDSNGQPVADHMARLQTFKRKLNEARNQSKPLLEIDTPLNAVIHSAHPQLGVLPLVQGFPFPVGHPARDLVNQVVGGNEGIDRFTDRETESVLISSFIEYPVHPMVVSSFTQPLATVIQNMGGSEAQLRGAFWLWRRTKVIRDFAPLPDEIRRSIIRGFAVARMLGYVTADPSQPITISSKTGPLTFPFPLLTDVSQDNILPALIESFSMCYAEVATKGISSFNAYHRLFDLGEGTGHMYVLADDARTFVDTGKLPLQPVDNARYESAGGATEEERSANLEEYLEANIARFKTLARLPFTGQENRDQFGTVHPEDTLTIELLDELLDAYEEVLTSITTRATGGVV